MASLGASYKWYSASTGGSALAGTTVLATGTYYVSQTSNSCESTRASVVVTITTNPVKPILGSINQPTCSTFTGNFTITNYNSSYTYTISPNGATLNTTTGVVTATKGVYKVTATLNSCASEISDEVEINSILCANADPFGTKTSGATAVTVGNVKTNDTLNGAAVTADNTTVTPKTDGVLSVDAAGVVTLAANSPSGSYSIVYEICELNTANCKTATATVDVVNEIKAVKETTTAINGSIGGTTIALTTNDTLNENPVSIGSNPGQVSISIVGTLPTGLTLNANGTITVVPNTPAANYNVEYSICEVGANPVNCSSVISVVPVTAGDLVANPDTVASVTGSNTPQILGVNVLDNDTKNGVKLNPSDVILTESTPDPKGYLVLNPDGTVTLGANAPAGDYELTYTICEKLNTDNCKSNTVTVTVTAPVIDAVTETTASINGSTGGTTASLTANDTLDGKPFVVGSNPGEVTISIVGTLPTGLTLNANGTITVAPNTPKGNYNVEYRICDNNNLGNCDQVISVVPVTAGDLVANPDTVASVTGSNTPQTLGVNVLDNDTKNGVKLNPADVILTESTPDPKGYLVLNPDGTVTLGANAPAGDYELTYTICEKLNTDNCKSNTVKVTVKAPVIDAVTETTASINGNTGGTTASLTANDTLDGKPFVTGTNPGEVTISIVGTLPTGLTLNANGTITVSPNTPKGNYNVEYRICDNNNSGNCDQVISVVPVTAGDLVANPDTVASVTGSNTSQILGVNVLDNDTKNGVKLNPSDVILTESTPDPKGYLVLNPDGTVTLGANAPAGDYELTYTICEKLNTDNCKSNTVTVTVTAPVIDAVTETTASINGSTGGTTASLTSNDTLDGKPFVTGSNSGEVTISIVGTLPTGLTLNANGTITVAPNTPKGNYNVEYRICDNNNSGNCDTVISVVPVTAGDLVANPDTAASVTGSNTPQTLGVNVLDNDTKNGVKLNPSDVILTESTPDPKGYLVLNPDGTVTLGANAPAGDYELTYTICEKLNTDNCKSNTVTVTVTAPVIDAVGETLSPSINGSIGGTTTDSVIGNDTLNGNPAVIGTLAGQVKLTAVNVPAGLTLNTDGTVTVAANTPSGVYDVAYRICEITNPSNCDDAISKVAVNNGTLVANSDDIPAVTSSSTGKNLGVNIFTNDTKNSQPLNPSDVTLTVSTPDPKGYLTVDSDGNVSLGANAPSGDYELIYTICEKLNPGNCSSNTVRVTVSTLIIDAVEETLTPSINGSIGGTTTSSVIENDTLNGSSAVIGTLAGQVKLTAVNVPAGLTLNADGTVTVAANTPSGIYNIEYSICENANPSNCDTAISKVTVNNGTLIANADNISSVKVSNTAQNLGVNIFTNDTKNGTALNPSDVNLTISTPDPKGYLTVNPDGSVSLGANAPAGDYELTYTICEKLNPGNCSSNTVRITVESNLVANLDSVPSVVGINTPQTLINVFANDTKDGNPLVSSDVILTTTTADPKGYLSVDANGNAILAPNAPAGDYELTYSICDKLNLSNCSTNVVKVTVKDPVMNTIVANNDEEGPIDVKKGMNATINIFANDFLNGVRPNASDVVLTIVVANPNVTLNADGTVSIAPNTPDGVYNVTYQICEAANTSNCSQSAVVKITVVNSVTPIDPEPPMPNKITLVDDTNISVDGINGDIEFINVLGNDLINGQPINPADVIVKPLTTDNYFEWNADGTVSVKPNTPGKTYTLTYQVCEKADPSNCATAVLTVFVEVPAIAVVKKATFNDENKDGFANAGETITYNFTVTNTGNVPLRGITINDPLPGVTVSGQAIDLAVNESNGTNFTAVYRITQEDINRKTVTNQAIAKGSSERGVVVEDQSDDSDNNGDNPTVINLDGCTIEVLKAFSPNGDSKNERFYIRGIECYPDNTVEIYNRWGVLVFSIDQYNNNDRAFRGYSNGRSTIKQTEGLPVGTYFYILKYKDNANAPQQKSGYLYINK
ncbi:T9SS type B sorting domain-containing protein [Flavobacterium quisquiliarum]|uniref:Gliding motility-associated C-terminal domain-containing protein n=2 Tax=Flavobacterium quisquiliarum TaxID=1834436 RepID=A0ABV8W8F3_9FLAO